MRRILIVLSVFLVTFIGSCQKEDDPIKSINDQGVEKNLQPTHFVYNASGYTYIGGTAVCGQNYEHRYFVIGGLASGSQVPLRADYCYRTITMAPAPVNATITNGKAIYIGENGDKIYATFSATCQFGNYTFIPQANATVPLSLTFVGLSSGKITGGTGQYFAVSGSFTLTCYQNLGPLYLGSPSPTIMRAEGFISQGTYGPVNPSDN
ncbi:MAG TPA: hypothetical protein VK172_14360 [Lentimicrobium sp.]|nr:hypothetical protein [Lentimicrobium sp.]